MPIEMEMEEALQATGYVAEESVVILAHPRDKEQTIQAIKKLKGTRGDKTLSFHYQTPEEKIEARKTFKKYWHRFERVIWNNVSAPGSIPAVRHDNLDAADCLFSKYVYFIDCDLDHRAYRYKHKKGEPTARKHPLTGAQLLGRMRWCLRIQKLNDRFCIGLKGDDNNLDRQTWRYDVPLLGGTWCFNLEMYREHKHEFPGNNPFWVAMICDMKRVEDIAASWQLTGYIARYEKVSWDGDRDGYNNLSPQMVLDNVRCRILTEHLYMQKSLRKRWTKRGPGELVVINMLLEGVSFDINVMNPNVDHIAMPLIAEAAEISHEHADLYKGVLDAN